MGWEAWEEVRKMDNAIIGRCWFTLTALNGSDLVPEPVGKLPEEQMTKKVHLKLPVTKATLMLNPHPVQNWPSLAFPKQDLLSFTCKEDLYIKALSHISGSENWKTRDISPISHPFSSGCSLQVYHFSPNSDCHYLILTPSWKLH